jgi:hypothetical protein
MRRQIRKWLGAAALGLALAASGAPLVGCEDEGTLEEAGEELDDELDDATDDR